jgi:hypothetical protein
MNTSFSRIKHHTITSTGSTLFTVPLSQDFTDGTWVFTDLVESEFGIKSSTGQAFVRIGTDIYQLVLTQATGTTFSGLTVAGPTGAVQYNNAGNLAGVSGFTFDQSNGDFKVVNDLGGLYVGDSMYGSIPLTGHTIFYNNPLSAATYVSGFFTGDLRPYGDTDYSSSFGFRNVGAGEARNFNSYTDRVGIISRDSAGDGIEIEITDLLMTLALDKKNSSFDINDEGGGNLVRVDEDGTITFHEEYNFPLLNATVSGSSLTDPGNGNLYWQAPKRYTNYFDFSSNTVTTIAVADTWYKLSSSTTQGFSNDGLIHTTNRITNSGATGVFKLEGIVSLQSSATNVLGISFFKNGSLIPCSEQRQGVTSQGGVDRAGAIPFQCIAELALGDYIEVYVKNITGTNNITLDNLNVIIHEM